MQTNGNRYKIENPFIFLWVLEREDELNVWTRIKVMGNSI